MLRVTTAAAPFALSPATSRQPPPVATTSGCPSRPARRPPLPKSWNRGDLVATTSLDAPAGGLQGLVAVDRELLLLDPAHTDLSKTARAFAAESLAPAEGIRDYLAVLPEVTTSAFEAVAGSYDVSPLLVQHQYDNQIARTES